MAHLEGGGRGGRGLGRGLKGNSPNFLQTVFSLPLLYFGFIPLTHLTLGKKARNDSRKYIFSVLPFFHSLSFHPKALINRCETKQSAWKCHENMFRGWNVRGNVLLSVFVHVCSEAVFCKVISRQLFWGWRRTAYTLEFYT